MKLPKTAPVLTIANGILFPRAILPFYIVEPRSCRLIQDVLRNDRLLVIAMQRAGWRLRQRPEPIAGLGLLRACVRYPDGSYGIFVEGLARVELIRTRRYRPYRVADIAPVRTYVGNQTLVRRLCIEALQIAARRLQSQEHTILPLMERLQMETIMSDTTQAVEILKGTLEQLAEAEEPEQIADLLCAALINDPYKQQQILATRDLTLRLQQLIQFLDMEEMEEGEGKWESEDWDEEEWNDFDDSDSNGLI